MTTTRTKNLKTDKSKSKPDKYDTAVDYLTRNPEEIYSAWRDYKEHQAGCLFCRTGPSPADSNYGCLTQVKRRFDVAGTPELTRAIRADKHLVDYPDEITPAHLPIFAKWQRRIDKELGRGV